jgi:hypothetical protein
MCLSAFTCQLLAEGRPVVGLPEPITADDRAATAQVLAEFEALWRLDAAGQPPDFHPEAAVWAAVQLHRACQYAVFRNESNFEFEGLERPSELAGLPAAHYSVDLTFQFLPDVITQVRAAASDDPLLTELLAWAAQWPLSSVGVAGVSLPVPSAALATIVHNPSLLAMYVDRTIDRHDASRLAESHVRKAVVAAIGVHGGLAPQLTAAMAAPMETL